MSKIWTTYRAGLAAWCRGRFVPVKTMEWEWLLMRIFLALLVFYALQEFKPFSFEGQPVPRGIARFIDLSFLHEQGPINFANWRSFELPGLGTIRLHGKGWFDTTVVLAFVIGALYIWGRGLVITTPLLMVLHLLPWTYSNSQGFTHHGNQLVTMVLLVQSAVLITWHVRRLRGQPMPAMPLRSWLIYYSQGMVAFAYVACAVTKLVNTRGLWLFRSDRIGMELIKSHRLEYYEVLNPDYAGDPAAAVWLLSHPWITRLMFDAGFFLELLALLALRDRKWALLVGLAIVAFHRNVWWLMRLEFPMHEWLVLIFLVNVPFWCWWVVRGRRAPLTA